MGWFCLVPGGLSTFHAVGKGLGAGRRAAQAGSSKDRQVPGQQKGVGFDRAAPETGRKGASGCGRGQFAVCQQKSRESSSRLNAAILLFPVVLGTLSCP